MSKWNEITAESVLLLAKEVGKDFMDKIDRTLDLTSQFRRVTEKPSQWLFGFRIACLTALLCTISGCSVQDQKSGPAENVRLRTPVGSLDVRTNDLHGTDVGLPVYPGAVETPKHGNDSNSADIHMSFGNWQMGVKAIEYRSNDPEEKIVAFYRKSMSQYGDVLTCKDKTAMGEPAKTRQGLSCANDYEYDLKMNMGKSDKHGKVQPPSTQAPQMQDTQLHGDIKLLAGSPENQHIVDLSPDHGGTKFSLVVLQFPQHHPEQTD